MPLYEGQRLPPMINLQQYYIEDALLAAVQRANAAGPAHIDIRWATAVDALEAAADGVSLGLANALGRGTLQADWVVACDGGQSFVRNALGLALEGTAYTGRYVIVDIELPSTHPTERRAWFDPPWHRGATVLMHRQPDDLWRIDWQLRHGDSTEEAMQAGERARLRAAPPRRHRRRPPALEAGVELDLPRRRDDAGRATATAACSLPAMPRMRCRSSACAG